MGFPNIIAYKRRSNIPDKCSGRLMAELWLDLVLISHDQKGRRMQRPENKTGNHSSRHHPAVKIVRQTMGALIDALGGSEQVVIGIIAVADDAFI